MGSFYNFTFECQYPPSNTTAASSSSGSSRVQLPSVEAAFGNPFMPSLQNGHDAVREAPPPTMTSDPSFDILDWYPAYQSCQRYFLDHAQHEQATQALCALINIRLPFQCSKIPIASSQRPGSASPAHGGQSSSNNSNFTFAYPPPNGNAGRNGNHSSPPACVSLIPYIRRLVVTGFDKPAILHGLFGDDYQRGVLPHLDCERRNYLFAARQGGWRNCKTLYDMGSGAGDDETVPFLTALDSAKVEELVAAEKAWKAWSAMENWELVSRAQGPPAPSREVEDGRLGGSYDSAVPNTGESQRAADNLPDGVAEAFDAGG